MSTPLTQPTILVIVGITGDLAERKLIPALTSLKSLELLPEKFEVIGASRKQTISPHSFITTVQWDPSAPASYVDLEYKIVEIEKVFGAPAHILFFLSVPPQAMFATIESLATLRIAPRAKLLLEKPFGTDIVSAQALINDIHTYFSAEQLYRVDHYLAKHLATELREADIAAWDARTIDHIDIIASESIGIESRAEFYEQTGALRDVVQSHLLQLAALCISDKDSDRLEALQSYHVIAPSVRGQYASYRNDAGNPKSTVETFCSITLASSIAKWQGVPITITTGKSLDRKVTEVRVYMKGGMSRVFDGSTIGGIEGYERVLYDAIQADKTIFVSDEQVLESWRIVTPVLESWAKGEVEPIIYPNGSTIEEVLTNT